MELPFKKTEKCERIHRYGRTDGSMKPKLQAKLLLLIAAIPRLAFGADQQVSPAVHPPLLIRADQDQIQKQVLVHSPDGSQPTQADFTAGPLSSPQPTFIARPTIDLVRTVAGSKTSDYIVDLSIEAMMPFGESSADLLYRGTQIDFLRFSRPGVAATPANGTVFVARQPGPLLLVLDNRSAFAYKHVTARLRFQDHDFCEFEVGALQGARPKGAPADCADETAWKVFEIPQYAQVTLRAPVLPPEWFRDPGSDYTRSGKATGTFTLHFTSTPASGQTIPMPPKIHELNLPLEMQFEPSAIALGFTLVRIFGLLALGAAFSFVLRVSLPNMKRKRALKDQLADMNKLIGGLSSEVDSRLRALLGSECLALDELRTETFPVAPNYAEYARRVEQGIPVLSRKIGIVQRLGAALERHRERINSGYEYRILIESADLLDCGSRLVQRDQIGEDDWITINQKLALAESMLEEQGQQARDAFEAKLANRWQALQEHFGPKDTAGTLIKGPWVASNSVKDMQPLFDSLPKEFFADDMDGFKKWIKDESGTGADADILVSALEYVSFVETIVPPKNPPSDWTNERASLCLLLANTTTKKLFDARDAMWRLHENIFKDSVKQALEKGKARLIVDPENPAVNQKFRISLCFPDPHLNEATARDELNCRWTLKTTMRGSRRWWKPWTRTVGAVNVKHEQGWHAFHYFESRSASAEISVDVFDGDDTMTLASNPQGDFPTISVTPTPNWRGKEKYARTILEMAQLAAALLVPLAALASSTVNGSSDGKWWTLVALGFGTDTIKNIILGKDETATSPAK
jgi:hypothetical protein